jgi:hypothetical protein
LEPGTLFSELKGLLLRYPENSPVQKAVHFVIYERGRKWLFEGEDRNRFFLWHTTPFYSMPFFQQAMRVPDGRKRCHALYRAFQRRLDASISQIPDASIGYAMSSPWFSWKLMSQKLAQKLPRSAREALKEVLTRGKDRRFEAAGEARPYFERIIGYEPARYSLMSPCLIRSLLPSITQRQFFNLWTLLLLEEVWTGKRHEH